MWRYIGILIVLIIFSGCVTTDGRYIIEISKVKEWVNEVISNPSTPDEICKKNVHEDLKHKEKIAEVAFKPIHIELKKVESIDEAINYLDSTIKIALLEYSVHLENEHWAWQYVPKKKNVSYVAVGVGEIAEGLAKGNRVYYRYACDEQGNIRTEKLNQRKPTSFIVDVDYRTEIEYPYLVFKYKDDLDETINVTVRVYATPSNGLSLKERYLLWENTIKGEPTFKWKWGPPGIKAYFLVEFEMWHSRYGRAEYTDVIPYYSIRP